MGQTPDEIELQIKQTRLDLAEKVDSFADQVKHSAGIVKEEAGNIKEKVEEVRSAGVKVAVVVFVAVIGILVIRRLITR